MAFYNFRTSVLLATALGMAGSAFAETITFDEVPLGTNINGKTIKGVLFSYTPPIWWWKGTPDPPIIVDVGHLGNLQDKVLLLPGDFSGTIGTLATLTLDFLDGPINSLGFQFGFLDPNYKGMTPLGTFALFDAASLPLQSTDLYAYYNPVSHNVEGSFAYSGTPVSRALFTIPNLVSDDGVVAIDTIAFQTAGTAPATSEPGTLLLIASALVGLGAKRRYFRHARGRGLTICTSE